MYLILAILLSAQLCKSQDKRDSSSIIHLPPYPTKPNNIEYYFNINVRDTLKNNPSISVDEYDSAEDVINIDKYKTKIELILEEFKTHTCLQFKEADKPVNRIGINFFESKDKKNHVELSRSIDNATNVTLTEKVYKDPFTLRYFIAKALGLMPEIQRIDREAELTIFNDRINEDFYKEYEESTYYYSYFFESDFDFKSAAMPINYLGLKDSFKKTKNNITYQSVQYPYYDLMLKKRYDFFFTDYRKLSYMYCNYSYEENKCENGGYPYNFSLTDTGCKCPTGYNGDRCEKIHFQKGSCPGFDEITAGSPIYKNKVLKGVSGNCYLRIKASNSMGKVQIKALGLKCDHPCVYTRRIDLIEIKYRDDKGVKGISLFTNQFRSIELPALSNEVTIMFLFNERERCPEFTFEYREVIPESKWPYWMDTSFKDIKNEYKF